MGSLRTLTILLALGAWGAATEGAPLDDGTSPTSGTTRPALSAPAVEYLKGGIRLYNTGDQERAAKYLKVASDYRDQLSPTDIVQLESYLAKMSPAPSDPAVRPAATDTDGTGSPAPAASASPTSSTSLAAPRATSDPKQEARWKLQAAKEQLRQGNYDEATQIVLDVQKMNIKWGLFDETPTKLAEAIAKARPKATASPSTAVHDKKTALAKLKEAREMLANNQYDQAEVVAMDVKTWGIKFGMFDDQPDKIAASARALRRRDEARNTSVKAQPSVEQYDVLVSEARHYVATGEYDLAEARAKQALRMNVYPSGTADRAEAVLNDISVAKAKMVASAASPASASPAPSTPVAVTNPARKSSITAVAETPSLVAEREANALLAKGEGKAAAEKFVEAENLRAREIAGALPVVAAAPVIDRSVRQVAANPTPAPTPTPAPAASPAALPALEAPAVAAALPDPAAPPVLASPEQTPAPIGDPASPPAAMPVPEAAPLSSALPSLSSDTPPAGNKGEELLSQARSLFTSGNYAAAREKATEARAGNYGVNAQADEMLAQIGLSEQGGALAVYELALDYMRKNEVERARALLTEVAASGAALDEGMLQKVQGLLMKLPKEGTKGTAVASDVPANDAETMLAQQMNAEVGTKVAEARRLMEVDPEKGIELLQMTLAKVKAADMPQTVARTMTRRLEVAIELAKTDKVKFDAKMQDKDAKADIETKKLRILEADKVKKLAIKDLMTKAEEANAKGDYAKAEELARRANEIDPNEIGPQMLAFKANMQRHYELDKENKRNKEEGFLNEMQAVDQAMIIDSDLMRNGISYPKTFKEMSDRRKKMQLSDGRQKSMQELATEKKLNEPITLNLKDQTIDEAISFISNYTGLTVILDSKALNEEGLTRDSKVNLTANSIKLKSALKYMLQPLGLTYKAEEDVLLITSPQASRDKTYTWTYPVADLVVSPTRSKGTSPNDSGFPNANPAFPTPGSNGATQNGSFSTNVERTVTMADMMPLVQLISTTIAPGTWQVGYQDGEQGVYGMGGGFGQGGADAPAQPGSITPFLLSISLIIRHTAEVHEEVAELLKQLRRLQDLQVSIEVRFITVSDDFFEQIGVDFDFAIQSKSVGKGTSFAAPSGSAQAASYPFNLVSTTSTTGGTAGTTGGGTGSNTTGGTAGGGAGTGGTTGTTGGTTTGGTTGGIGGAGGGGGGFAGGGGGIGGAGNFGGGGGGTAGGTAGGTTTTAGTSGTGIGYIVNPFLDNSLGRRTPVVVGTSAGGIGNYTNNLAIPFTQGSAANIQPFNSIPSAGATFGISFLSDLEMYLFLTAAQGDARNNIVQAPKVTTFNGANASIQNSEQQYYVQQLTPIVGPGSVSFFPTPAPLNDGVFLSVTPVVSADRRYVRLSLAPTFQTINGLQSFPVPAAVGGGGLGGTGTAITGQIQLPQTTVTTINTTVTVPDGGTVLMGGVKRMREQRLEYGVPVLAKTPLINRLFRNIGIGRRTDSLMLMVTPRIIILEEEEDRLGVRTINSAP